MPAAASYLLELTTALKRGIALLPANQRARHIRYLQTAQNADGGFSGRAGDSDLYYTAFALRGLAVLEGLTPNIVTRAGDFLRQCLQRHASVVDFFSLLYGAFILEPAGEPILAGSAVDWQDRVALALESFRAADGGYGKNAGSVSGSVYHTFLVGLCYQVLGRPLPRPNDALAFIFSRRREDGGFVEIAPMRKSGTNPTAAAVGLLEVLIADQPASALEPGIARGVARFLAEMQSPEGGLRGNGRAPAADLLSTFTGCWTLYRLGALDAVQLASVLRYVLALERSDGGFHGGLWDEGCDVEYTFYGLGTLALFDSRRLGDDRS
jgi:geranylgeranyl transferase type-2 subunit beta